VNSYAIYQVEVSAYHTNDGVVEWCRGKGIVVSCFAPFGAPARFWKQEGEPDLMEEEIVKQIAAETGKTAGQVKYNIISFHFMVPIKSEFCCRAGALTVCPIDKVTLCGNITFRMQR